MADGVARMAGLGVSRGMSFRDAKNGMEDHEREALLSSLSAAYTQVRSRRAGSAWEGRHRGGVEGESVGDKTSPRAGVASPTISSCRYVDERTSYFGEEGERTSVFSKRHKKENNRADPDALVCVVGAPYLSESSVHLTD